MLMVTVVDEYRFGALFILGFYLFETKQASPLVPFSMFDDKNIRWMNIHGFFGWAAFFGTASLIPLFLQKMAHLSILMSGVALIGSAVGWMSAAVPAGKWILKYGYRPLFIVGSLSLTVSGVLLVLLRADNGFWYAFFVMVIQGFAFGLLSTTGVIGAQQLV
ncbi:MFS transporter [Laceyella sediminis]|uniref:MFS transporter n=2 Tax=Laceyella sediminis TaxID=573074 RepID=A0ABX5EQ48_9BACL|nr:MFS transporter [Laceyella sediminis]